MVNQRRLLIPDAVLVLMLACSGCIEHYQKGNQGVGDAQSDADGLAAGDASDQTASVDLGDLLDSRVPPDVPEEIKEIKEVESELSEVHDGEVLIPDVCTPDCAGRNCGDDGCKGVCGQCSDQEQCEAGICTCQPTCDAKECGDDGCGSQCGSCAGGETCQSGTCVVTYPWTVSGGPGPFVGESTDGVWALRPVGPVGAPATPVISDGTWSLEGRVLLGGQ